MFSRITFLNVGFIVFILQAISMVHGESVADKLQKLPTLASLTDPKVLFKINWPDPWIFKTLDGFLSEDFSKRQEAMRLISEAYMPSKDALAKLSRLEINQRSFAYTKFLSEAIQPQISPEQKIYTRLVFDSIIGFMDTEWKSQATIIMQSFAGGIAPSDTLSWRIAWPQTNFYQSLIPATKMPTFYDPRPAQPNPPSSGAAVPVPRK